MFNTLWLQSLSCFAIGFLFVFLIVDAVSRYKQWKMNRVRKWYKEPANPKCYPWIGKK